jgi:hypothetical protein
MPWTARRKAKLVTRLLITMTLAVTGPGTVVALSFVIHFPS